MNSSAFMENLKQLFAECDTDQNGSLGREEFSELCSKIGLSKDAAAETFDRLDIDKNERITFDEFAAGFNQYKQTGSLNQPPAPKVNRISPTPDSEPTDPLAPDANQPPRASSQPSTPKAPRSPPTQRRQKLSPSPVSARARKTASPLGALALGSTGSSSNLTSNRSTSGNFADNSSEPGSSVEATSSDLRDNMVVYSSDMISDYDQGASGSGQFGSMLSSNGSFSQLRNMQDLLDCVQKLQSENQILTQIFFKDKREREEYINQLGEEFDLQLKEVEERANRRAREELESEKKRLREMMQAERETLEHHYQTIEKMSRLVKSPNGRLDEGENFDKVKTKLEDTFLENRQLKRSLLDTKTDVAMIWKEMEKLKSQYEDKLTNAYEKHNETKSECDHIKQQLNLMKDSNRKLQDASDVITSYIADKVDPVIKGATGEEDPNFLCAGSGGHPSLSGFGINSQSGSRRGSILSEYLNGDQSNSVDGSNDLESMASSRGFGDNSRANSKYGSKTSQQQNNNSESLRSPETGGDNIDASKLRKSITDSSINGQQQDSISTDDQSKINSLKDSKQTVKAKSGLKDFGRSFFLGSRSSSDAKLQSKDIETKSPEPKSVSADAIDEPIVEPSDGPSEATFNIILVGDSFVGKSSFAARFMEGSFVQGLISNCSIDFKTKSYKVDGTNYTVNLWDTAGQERFRSITASYFRKADGIILMYDVTERRSYINVRNWMSTISDTAAENVAVLLVGNKIDLRRDDNRSMCVPTEEGSRLAMEYEIVFLETSVKTGTNLLPSMGRLIRLIAKNNSSVEEDTDRIRLNDKSKMFNCMPKNC